MTSILEVKKAIEPALLENDDVMGVGLTPDRQNIIIYVRIPLYFDFNRAGGYPAIVLVTGPLAVHGFERYRIRPLVGGISAGDYNTRETGTLGMVVYDRETGEPLLMSNNHVFARMSTEKEPKISIGDPIIQPGEVDGGGEGEIVGYLERYVPWKDDLKPNIADVALARPNGEYYDGILSNGFVIVPHGTKTVRKGIHVYKVGRTTGRTEGRVIDTDFTVDVVTGEEADGSPKYTRFVDQILIEMDSLPGDSGSIIMAANNKVAGLLFAGGYTPEGKSLVVANKIRNVFAIAGVDIK